jgi:hypothetical protein
VLAVILHHHHPTLQLHREERRRRRKIISRCSLSLSFSSMGRTLYLNIFFLFSDFRFAVVVCYSSYLAFLFRLLNKNIESILAFTQMIG